MKIGIRKEDKSIWERRVPFVPDDIQALRKSGLNIVVESSENRVFKDVEFDQAGIPVQKNLKDCGLIFGIKEIPQFDLDKIYVFFAHVIKGQAHNMPMLKQMMAQNATLIDYEKIADDQGRRLIFFGRHAGLAGMVNSLWALGRRLEVEGIDNPFSNIRQMRTYNSLKEAQAAVKSVAEDIKTKGLPLYIHPLIIGVAGYGNVSKGAQEILDLLPVKEIAPEDVKSVALNLISPNDLIYKVIFKEKHCVQPKDSKTVFDLQDYYAYGKEKYVSCFESYLNHLSLLVNCVYWDERYPCLVTKEACKKLWVTGRQPGLRVIGDISCDIEGAVECTIKSTDPGDPAYVYQPETGKIIKGFEGHGPVIMAVDILPTELPRESSQYFSQILKKFIHNLAEADYTVPFENLNLMPELKKAVILHKGRLTPNYEYIKKYL